MHQLIDKKNKIIIYLLLLFILSTTNSKFLENQSSSSTMINQINIEGLSNADNMKIYKELKNLFYKNILLVRKDEIKKIIDKYNIIEEYKVKKIYPSTINIKIKPTKFVARISVNDQLVGANGKLIKDKENKVILPYIFGQFNSQEFLKFTENVLQSKFSFTRFKTIYFFFFIRWDILTNNNILSKLPQDNVSESINLVYIIMSNNEFKNKNFIDLRINNHLIIK